MNGQRHARLSRVSSVTNAALSTQLFKDSECWSGQSSNPRPPARWSDIQPTELVTAQHPLEQESWKNSVLCKNKIVLFILHCFFFFKMKHWITDRKLTLLKRVSSYESSDKIKAFLFNKVAQWVPKKQRLSLLSFI